VEKEFFFSNLTSLVAADHIQVSSHCHTISAMSETPSAGDHQAWMRVALSLARKSPLKLTNFRVGAVLLDTATNTVLSTGYTLELPGNTHAEQCCFLKLASQRGVPEDELAAILPEATVLYTTMEPCSKRLSGEMPCVQRILRLGGAIKTVFVGVAEPNTFIAENPGRVELRNNGIDFVPVTGLEQDVLAVATEGHQ
jgi:pyrimidine deaminase RibD-like protein